MTNISRNKTARIIGFSSIATLMLTASVAGAAPKNRPAPTAAPVTERIREIPVAAELVLKSEAVVNDEVVRLSDLISGLEAGRDAPIFRAPELGQIGTIQAQRIIGAASELGIKGVDTHDLTAVVVRRAGHIVPRDQMLELVVEALRSRYGLPSDTDLVIDKTIKPLIVEAEARRAPQLASFTYDGRLSRFDASFIVPGSELTGKVAYRITGTLGETVRVPIVIRNLNKGDTISQNDISIEKRKRTEIAGETPVDLTKVAGQISKRGLRVGDIIGSGDITRAEWVERGATVTLIYESAGISLSTKGKAVTAGSDGDTVSIQNLQSKRVIEGIVTGPGKVSVQNKSATQTLAKSALFTAPDAAGTTPTRTALAISR